MGDMVNVLRGVLDPTFGHPRGLLGRLGGSVMARGNTEQEHWAVAHAELRPGEQVLEVGSGPGVGVQLAAGAVGPSGHVVGIDPSTTMRQMATARCEAEIRSGIVQIRPGGAETTGCSDASIDAALSVNNVMLWDRQAGLAELARVLRPAGRLVITVHQHVLDTPAEQLREHARAAGFDQIELTTRARRWKGPAVELVARRAR